MKRDWCLKQMEPAMDDSAKAIYDILPQKVVRLQEAIQLVTQEQCAVGALKLEKDTSKGEPLDVEELTRG